MSRVLMLSAHLHRLDRRIVAEANALVQSGREVTVLSAPVDTRGAGLDARVDVRMSGSPAPARLADRLRALPEPVRNTLKPLRYRDGAGPARRWERYFDALAPRERFDVIHCHDLETLPAAVRLRRARRDAADTRIVYDAHELFPHQFHARRQREYWTRLERRHIGEADLVITVNGSLAGEIARAYDVTPPSVIYNSYGVASGEAVDREAFLRHFGVRGGDAGNGSAASVEFAVIFPGNLTREKNVAALAEAFASLDDTEYGLFLLGGGPMTGAVRRLVARRRIANVFLGPPVAQRDLLPYLAHADLGVIPYVANGLLNNRYCTPNKLFEFIQAGVPVCASDLPELRKLVGGNGIGVVAPMETPGQIADAIRLGRERCRAGAFPPEVLDAARKRYAWAGQARALVGLYERLGA